MEHETPEEVLILVLWFRVVSSASTKTMRLLLQALWVDWLLLLFITAGPIHFYVKCVVRKKQFPG